MIRHPTKVGIIQHSAANVSLIISARHFDWIRAIPPMLMLPNCAMLMNCTFEIFEYVEIIKTHH